MWHVLFIIGVTVGVLVLFAAFAIGLVVALEQDDDQEYLENVEADRARVEREHDRMEEAEEEIV